MNSSIMKIYKLVTILVIFISISCSAQRRTSSYYESSTTYLNAEADGSITVRAYGMGRNRQDAIEQAWKNAVHDIIFKGVNVPGNTFISKPILTEVNAEEKYALFFNGFFSDKGEFMQFVSSEDTKRGSTRQSKNKIQNKIDVTVRVMRPQLIQYLKDADIIK